MPLNLFFQMNLEPFLIREVVGLAKFILGTSCILITPNPSPKPHVGPHTHNSNPHTYSDPMNPPHASTQPQQHVGPPHANNLQESKHAHLNSTINFLNLGHHHLPSAPPNSLAFHVSSPSVSPHQSQTSDILAPNPNDKTLLTQYLIPPSLRDSLGCPLFLLI